MRRTGGLRAGWLLVLALFWAPAASGQPAFGDWAAVVIAGDDHASHTENHTEAFDNARRDIAAALQRKGFAPANMAQVSVRPERYGAQVKRADATSIFASLTELAARARGGCLIYVTSHGSPDGVVIGDHLLPPRLFGQLIDRTCGARPTVVIISACFSGVFVPALKGDDRMVLTAARRDRSSFGCGESDRYPFFDGCVLEALPAATGFIPLARASQICVGRRERQEGMSPPSQPQLWVGATIARVLAASPFPPG